jgi:very-short-patch-repair endonuclease
MKGLSVEYPMYYGAKASIFKLAKELRKTQTEAEKILWSKLNKNQVLGLQFRRQHPIDKFIADFFCPKIKLIIEIDGSIHDIPEHHNHDLGRTDILNDFGITVVRFSNEQIITEIDYTVNQIEKISEKLINELP